MLIVLESVQRGGLVALIPQAGDVVHMDLLAVRVVLQQQRRRLLLRDRRVAWGIG